MEFNATQTLLLPLLLNIDAIEFDIRLEDWPSSFWCIASAYLKNVKLASPENREKLRTKVYSEPIRLLFLHSVILLLQARSVQVLPRHLTGHKTLALTSSSTCSVLSCAKSASRFLLSCNEYS